MVSNPGISSDRDCTIPCNLCTSVSVETLSLRDRKGKYLRTVICRKCGLIWSDPRPDDTAVLSFYSKHYRKEYKGITAPKKKHVYRDAKSAMKRYAFFKDILKTGNRLIDIGAGNGIFVYCMRKMGFNAEGVSPDEGFSRYAREALDLPVLTGFAKDIDKKNYYRFVTLHHVLEHMTDPLAELKNIWEMLQNDGFLYVSVPNAEDVMQDPGHRYHKAHIYTFNPETLTALGQKAGFELLRLETAPCNGNISVLFKKKNGPLESPVHLDGNYSKIVNILNNHTTLRHFASAVPYKKALMSMWTAVIERLNIGKFSDDREMIDTVVSTSLQPTLTGVEQTGHE